MDSTQSYFFVPYDRLVKPDGSVSRLDPQRLTVTATWANGATATATKSVVPSKHEPISDVMTLTKPSAAPVEVDSSTPLVDSLVEDSPGEVAVEEVADGTAVEAALDTAAPMVWWKKALVVLGGAASIASGIWFGRRR